VNDACHISPESAFFTFDARSATRGGNVCAWEAPANDIDLASPWSPVEGGDVIPDWEGIEHPVSLSGE
jgi:hypothetical protein